MYIVYLDGPEVKELIESCQLVSAFHGVEGKDYKVLVRPGSHDIPSNNSNQFLFNAQFSLNCSNLRKSLLKYHKLNFCTMKSLTEKKGEVKGLLFINCLSITISYPCLQDGG